jgi:signal transduction histidine kinase
MSPVARLTGAAKEITRTRDPGVSLPKPESDDEVADLARTLEEMLAALDAAQDETEAALTRQREFVADASHELRTPLTSILTNLELLEVGLAGEDREIAASALRSSHRMRRLVGDLLLLARADAGRQARREPVDVGAVVREAAGEVAPTAVDHELTVDVDGRGLMVDGVPDDLHRLSLNLIGNAVAHTPSGTNVRASVKRDGSSIVLTVEDDGPGIPPDLGERIFERFVRGAGDTGDGGSGLGLAIVRAVAEGHGGSVALESPAGGGARFVVRLPVVATDAPVTPPQPQAAP